MFFWTFYVFGSLLNDYTYKHSNHLFIEHTSLLLCPVVPSLHVEVATGINLSSAHNTLAHTEKGHILWFSFNSGYISSATNTTIA